MNDVPQIHKSRQERKKDIYRFLIGAGGYHSLLSIARGIGMKKSPHLFGIVFEMVQDGDIAHRTKGYGPGIIYEYSAWAEDQQGNSIVQNNLPF